MNTTPNKNRKTFLMKTAMFVAGMGLIGLIFPSCNKNKNEEKASLSVRMTDAPAAYNAVLIDLQGVEITGSGGSTVLLNTNAGIYNLLDFANGLDTLIAIGDLDAGNVSQIRLILGPNNSVIVDNVTYPLATPSAEQSGLKLLVNRVFEPGVAYAILLDFDANQSIVLQGNGEYKLKPVIRTVDAALTGSIRGSITPIGLIASVTATSNGLYYSSVTNLNGEFLIAGLPSGTYDVIVTPPFPLSQVTVYNKTVTTGTSTHIGIVAL